MGDDPQEIYSAPSETPAMSPTSVSNIRKAFEAGNKGGGMPIKLATDGRHQSQDGDKAMRNNASKVSFRPKPSGKPPLLQGVTLKKVGLPKENGAVQKSDDNNNDNASNDGPPPLLPDKTSSKVRAQNTSIKNRDSRESIFPPDGPRPAATSPMAKTPPKTLAKTPAATAVNRAAGGGDSPTNRSLPPQPQNTTNNNDDDDQVHTNIRGSFKKRPLPPERQEPPTKPASLPVASVQLPTSHAAVLRARVVREAPSVVGEEPQEIYDDVSVPLASPDPSDSMRPVSLIPEMTEDDEEDEEERKRLEQVALSKAMHAQAPRPPGGGPPPGPPPGPRGTDDQEVYDDVMGAGQGDSDGEEIYEDI